MAESDTTAAQTDIAPVAPGDPCAGFRDSSGRFLQGVPTRVTVTAPPIGSPHGIEPGRPRLFATASELRAKCAEYMETCKASEKPLTMAGLAHWLGTGTSTVYQYLDGKPSQAYAEAMANYHAAVEAEREEALMRMHGQTSGVQFALRSMHARWRTDQQVSVAHTHQHTLVVDGVPLSLSGPAGRVIEGEAHEVDEG